MEYLITHEREERAVSPKAPEVRNPVTARPTTIAAGTRIGLKMMKRGVVMARPTTVMSRVKPARASRVPPTGSEAMTASTLEAEGPPPRSVSFMPPS